MESNLTNIHQNIVSDSGGFLCINKVKEYKMDLTYLAQKLIKNKKISAEELDFFQNYTNNMPEEWSNKQKAYHIITGNLIQPVCKICGNVAKFYSKQYWQWCSNKCMGRDPEILEKKRNTNIKKWGVPHPQSLNEIKEKQQSTLFDKYGVTNFAKSNEFVTKSKKTFIEKYGVDNPSKNKEVIEKIRKKALDRNIDNVLQKRTITCMEKFGTPASSQRHLTIDVLNKLHDVEYLKYQHLILKKSCEEIAKELGCSPTPILTRLTNAGINVIRHQQSSTEKEILDYINQFTQTIEIGNYEIIPPRQIDIFIPEINLAIEVNGVYWHSELHGKDRNYHKSKTNECNQIGITLYHILDLEWNNSKEIIKSKIAGAFGKLTRISGRKCTVKEVLANDKSCFLDKNHLQGNCGSTVNLGLYYDNELVSLATFGKSRYNKKYEWELIRFCNKIYTSVQGGASKLLTHFIKIYNPKSIISYADMKWSTGNMYEKLGFKYSHTSSPNYFYFKKSNPATLKSRIYFQKHKLPLLFENVDLTKSEWEIMQENDYDRIWDCGNKVYIWENNGI